MLRKIENHTWVAPDVLIWNSKNGTMYKKTRGDKMKNVIFTSSSSVKIPRDGTAYIVCNMQALMRSIAIKARQIQDSTK